MKSAGDSDLLLICGRGLDDCTGGERVMSVAEADSSASLLCACQS